MKKVKILLVVLIAITLYANIGRVVGSYYFNYVFATPTEKLSNLGKAAYGAMPHYHRTTTPTFVPAWSVILFWWLPPLVAMISWVVYGCYYAGWFIFAGGGAKLLGLA